MSEYLIIIVSWIVHHYKKFGCHHILRNQNNWIRLDILVIWYFMINKNNEFWIDLKVFYCLLSNNQQTTMYWKNWRECIQLFYWYSCWVFMFTKKVKKLNLKWKKYNFKIKMNTSKFNSTFLKTLFLYFYQKENNAIKQKRYQEK